MIYVSYIVFKFYMMSQCETVYNDMGSICHALLPFFRYNQVEHRVTEPTKLIIVFQRYNIILSIKGVLHPWALFLKILCTFSKNKATSDKVSNGFGQKCSKELKNHSFTSAETIVVKLQ